MIDISKQKLKELLLSNGIRPTRDRTPNFLLEDFMRRVRPRSSQFDLIRLGSSNDGGYLVPDDLEGIKKCFSPGVSNVAEFELDLVSRGIDCFLADYSVDGPPYDNPNFHFLKKYIGVRNSETTITIDTWMDSVGVKEEDLIMQMDIEGSEYSVLLNAPINLLSKFRILIIEFHELDILYTKLGYDLVSSTFDKLLLEFDIVHIHPNNYGPPIKVDHFAIHPYMEFTLLRRDRIINSHPKLTFPHKLDRPNVLGRKDYSLPECWYK